MSSASAETGAAASVKAEEPAAEVTTSKEAVEAETAVVAAIRIADAERATALAEAAATKDRKENAGFVLCHVAFL